MTAWNNYLKENTSRYLEELIDFLRIPSISSLPEHAADVNRAAEWVADRLKKAGIEEVQILPTEGHPVVYGQWLHAADQPTIMIYGHFDTQPVDRVLAVLLGHREQPVEAPGGGLHPRAAGPEQAHRADSLAVRQAELPAFQARRTGAR